MQPSSKFRKPTLQELVDSGDFLVDDKYLEYVDFRKRAEREADAAANGEPQVHLSKKSKRKAEAAAGRANSSKKQSNIGSLKKLVPVSEELCRLVREGKTCSFPNCKSLHSVEDYLAKKPSDISSTCPVYDIHGWCQSGLRCRYGNGHIDRDLGVTLVKDGVVPQPLTLNTTEQDFLKLLMTKQYDFSEVDKVIKAASSASSSSAASVAPPAESEGSIVIESKEEIQFRQRKFKLKLADERLLYLAPLTTVGNLPFRRICREFGADITCGEMALADKLLQGQRSEWALVQKHSSETMFGAQICSNSVQMAGRCAHLIQERMAVDFLDLNCGCPIDLVVEKGGGSCLLKQPNKLEQMCRAITSVSSIPLTVKLRMGFEDREIDAFVHKMGLWGVDAIQLHGRTRAQRYTKAADWEYIERVADLCQLPESSGTWRPESPLVIGNGDIYTWQDAVRGWEQHKCGTVMIARGALIKPWLFQEIKERQSIDLDAGSRLDMIRKYASYGLEHFGSDTQGVETTRRFLLEWLSFLCRYVPPGILHEGSADTVRLGLRRPKCVGRSYLETLLMSEHVADWTHITSMFLGPPPAGFVFAPKHRAGQLHLTGAIPIFERKEQLSEDCKALWN
jgi:tRNA-dihydrouridine synthase 3